jgi:hypothetical protein
MKVKILDQNLKIKYTIIFNVKGGDFLDSLKADLKKDETKTIDLKKETYINDIKVFPDDSIGNLKEKIACITGIHPVKQFLWGKYHLGYDYIIEDYKFKLDINDLLKEPDNLLEKYEGAYTLIDLSHKKLGDLKEVTVLNQDDFTANIKFWPFFKDLIDVFDYNFYVKESTIFSQILDTSPLSRIHINNAELELTSDSNLDLLAIMSSINLKQLNVTYCHMYNGSHIVKYLDSYKIDELDLAGLNIVVQIKNINTIITLYPEGNILIKFMGITTTQFIDTIITQDISEIFKILKIRVGVYTYKKMDISAKYPSRITSNIFKKLKNINSELVSLFRSEEFNDRYVGTLFKGVETPYDIKIINEYSKLSIYVADILFSDIDFISRFLAYYINQISGDEVIEIDVKSINRNKRLLERDPIAYPKSLCWSRKCQGKKQPVIFNNSEFKMLSDDIKNKSIKYYNFTTKDNAYYYCPDKEYPELYFKSYKNIGLPCCQRTKPDKIKFNTILKTHIFIKSEQIGSSRYELSYDKIPGINRVTRLPLFLEKWIIKNKFKSTYKYKKYGVNQSVGMLGCFMAATETKAPKGLDINAPIFDIDEWNEQVKTFYDINLLLIKDRGGRLILISEPHDDTKEFIIIIDQRLDGISHYFPIFGINPKRFNNRQTIDKRLWTKDEFLISHLLKLKDSEFLSKILSMDVKKIYVYKGIILYILINYNGYVLLPINFPLIKHHPLITTKVPDLSLDYPIKLLYKLLNKLEINLNNVTSVVNDNKQVALLSKGLVYHHNTIPYNAKTDRRIIINYKLQDVYESIYSGKETRLDISKIINDRVKCDNIINEFWIKHTKKNKLIRKKIRSIIDLDIPINLRLNTIKHLIPDDYNLVKKSLIDNKSIPNITYSFDTNFPSGTIEVLYAKFKKLKYPDNVSAFLAISVYSNIFPQKNMIYPRDIIRHGREKLIII